MPRFLIILFFAVASVSAPAQWQPQDSGTDATLRGIHAVSRNVAWASGTRGTVLRTVDAGKHWQKVSVAGAEALDFRDVEAFDENTAFVLSAGPGDQSRIYKTGDGGRHWQLQFTNTEPKAFYDCFAFWDHTHAIAVSDPVDGNFLLLTTNDGKSWAPLHPRELPAAMANEGAFAASGTCITIHGDDVWFATGGAAARVFHSRDRGQTWIVANTPILSGAPSQGIFSIAFWTNNDGVIVGGDYKDPSRQEKNVAITLDGGKTWKPGKTAPLGYLSAVAWQYDIPTLYVVGINGMEFSINGGRRSWSSTNCPAGLNSVSFSPFRNGWAVGDKGRIMYMLGSDR